MIYAIYGALGALYTLALLAFGIFAGYHVRNFLGADHSGKEKHAESEEQSAFEEMLRYSMRTAYGMEEGGEAL